MTRQLQFEAVGCRHALSVITVPLSKPCCWGVSPKIQGSFRKRQDAILPPDAARSLAEVCVSAVHILRAPVELDAEVVPFMDEVTGREGVDIGEELLPAVFVAAAAFWDNLKNGNVGGIHDYSNQP
jgi:hypothetical protein